jgi:hypothetical protein
MYPRGRKVRTEYAVVTRTSRVAAMAVMTIFTGTRNATSPAKKRRRDACRRSGIMSTTRCILNLFMP